MKQTDDDELEGEDVRAGGRQHARRDEQAVAGQEEAEEQARFREDDREQADVPDGDEQLLQVDAGQHVSGATRGSG